MKLRHIVVLVLFILINVIVLVALMANNKEKEEEQESRTVVPFLKGMKVQNQTENFRLTTYGSVSSFKTVNVSSEVQGKLAEGISLKPGVKFRKGQLLFHIKDTEAKLNLQSRKSTFINLIANILPDIKVDYQSEYEKWEKYLAVIELERELPVLPKWKNNKEKVFLASRNILSEYYAIKSMEETMKKYHVQAPFDGMIAEVYLSDYAVVNPGAQIMKIIETGNYEIPVPVPISRLPFISVGSQAKIFTTSGTFKGLGEVVRMSEMVDKTTQSVNVFVKPLNTDSVTFVEGEYVQVNLTEKGSFKGVRLPHAAIRENTVLIYKVDSTLVPRKIQVLDKNEEGVFVDGLKNKQIVVTQEVIAYSDTTKFGIVLK